MTNRNGPCRLDCGYKAWLEQRIHKLELLFVDHVDPMDVPESVEKLWSELHHKHYPQNYEALAGD